MSLASRIANAFRPERLSREIDEEFRTHVEEAIAAGRDPEDARRAFGSLHRRREASHAMRVSGWLCSARNDLIFAGRQLRRSKLTTAAAVLSLGLGFGSCMSAFRLMDALLWRPLPVSGSSRLYVLSRKMIGLYGKPVEDSYWGTPEFKLMRDAVKDQADLIAISDADRTDLTWSSEGDLEKAHVAYVSGNMFSVFGVEPALGRLLTPGDDLGSGDAPFAVLSWDYWNHRFGRDPHVLGRSLHIGDRVFEIIGVGPRDFTGTENGTVTDIFLPLSMNNSAALETVYWHRTFLMLKPGVNARATLESLRLHLSGIDHTFEVERSKRLSGIPQASIDRYVNQTLVFDRAGAGISDLQKDYRRLLSVLALLVALVLLIACVNVANMMTAQAAARAREMALRISIGAGRSRLIQLILTQSALLALLASILGAGFATWSAPFVLSLVNPIDDPARLALSPDWRVFLFGFALMIVVVLLLGLIPALRASDVRPVAALKGGEDPHSSRRMMRGAVAMQVAFCCLVLFLGSLFVTSFQRLEKRPLGFSTDRLLLLETVAGKGLLPVVWNQTAEALRAAPGVDSVAISGWPILGHLRINTDISINGAPPGPTPAWFRPVSPGFFSTMKIPLVSGRDFLPQDTTPGAAIVNQTFVETFFPGQNPIGRTFSCGAKQPLNKIVGVTPDVPDHDLREPSRAAFFVPFNGIDDLVPKAVDFGTFVVHTNTQSPLALADSLRRLIAARHNGLRVSNVTTQLDLVRDQTIRERLIATLAAFFAAVALLLAGVGLYGMLSYSVVQRKREIGIRMVVGAPRRRIARLVTGEAAAAMLIGSAAGLTAGILSSRWIGSLLYDVRPTDARVLLLPLSGILLAASLASVTPLFRALRTNPAEILRSE